MDLKSNLVNLVFWFEFYSLGIFLFAIQLSFQRDYPSFSLVFIVLKDFSFSFTLICYSVSFSLGWSIRYMEKSIGFPLTMETHALKVPAHSFMLMLIPV